MTDESDKIYKSNVILDIIAIPIAIGTAFIAVSEREQDWFGVGAGFLALFALGALFSDYFNSPKSKTSIIAPNRFARISAGITGITSGIYWVLSAWPQLL